jgi:hypothetical protein
MTPVLLSDYVPQIVENAGVFQILFYRGGTIYAQNFDTTKRSLSGSPIPVVDQVDSGSDGQARFSVSRTGVLVYRVGGTDIDRRFTWFDRQGKILGAAGDPKYYWTFKLSQDASRVVYEVRDRENGFDSIFVLDLQHGGTTRITPDDRAVINNQPMWSPDERRISWTRRVLQDGKFVNAGVFQRATDASGIEETLISQTKYVGNATQWTPDGKYIISFGSMGSGPNQVVATPVNGGQPVSAVKTGFQDSGGYVSPNNRWIVYRSDQSGRNEVWVQPFPPTGKAPMKWMVSKDGALGGARWRKDGRELIFIGVDGYVMAVPVTTEPNFTSGTPERLFQLPKELLALSPVPGQFFDVTGDNQKFMALVPANRTPLDEFTVILNWPNAMKK